MNVQREQRAVDALSSFIDRLRSQPWREVSRSELLHADLELQALRDMVEHCARPWWRRVLGELSASRPWSKWRRVVPALVLAAALSGCRAPAKAVRDLERAGYSSVKLTGAAVGCCYDRPIGDGFEAVGPDGRAVRGCVCRYYWGSPVVRVDALIP